MKTKKVAAILTMILLLLFVSACSKNNGVSISQQKEDIIKYELIQNCYSSAFIPTDEFNLVSYQTTREQLNKEEKSHIIYSDVEIQNNYFNIMLSVVQEYNYYEKGGWFLDNVTIEDQLVSVAGPADANLVAKYLKNEFLDFDVIELRCLYNNELYELGNGTDFFGDKSELSEDGSKTTAHVVFESDTKKLMATTFSNFHKRVAGFCKIAIIIQTERKY